MFFEAKGKMKSQFTGNTAKFILHALAWVILIILPQYLSGRYFGNNNIFTWWFYLNTSTYLVIFYVNYLLLVPKLYFQGRRILYFVSVLLLLTGIYFTTEFANDTFFRRSRNDRIAVLNDSTVADSVNIVAANEYLQRNQRIDRDSVRTSTTHRRIIRPDSMDNRNPSDTLRSNNTAGSNSTSTRVGLPPDDNDRGPRPPGDWRRYFRPTPFQIYNYAFSALFFTIFSLGLKVMERQTRIEKRQKELEKEKLNSELALLKNQISPHFFFNTLNNIYSLIAINTADSQEAVLKLSKMMRYLLYESEHGETLLRNEIEFMNNYIDLMKLRMNEKVALSIKFPEENINLSIPPLLFIENAFKYGISYRDKSFINIDMEVTEGMLVFKCSNSIGKKMVQQEEHAGIGLENVKKRLKLLFPERHRLIIEKKEKEFIVELEIDTRNLNSYDQNHTN
jgi:hypothetical protein